MNPRIVAVVPARLASSRFPNKPLAEIGGLPMVEHVRRRALLSKVVDEVAVATCDRAIAQVVEVAGGKAVMTSDKHERCTTRVEEAMGSLWGDIVAIVQGDEPLLRPDAVDAVVAPLLRDASVQCTNLLSPLGGDMDGRDVGVVKAACDQRGNVLFFSRAPIPHFRFPGPAPVYRQTGIMAFRAPFLRAYTALPETPFERAESVDMLRLLEHGHRIVGVPVDYTTLGVDYPKDVPIAEAALRNDPLQRALHAQILNLDRRSIP